MQIIIQNFGRIPEKAILQGFMRRKIIPVGKVDYFLNPANEKIYENKLENINFSEENYRETLIQYLEVLRNNFRNIDFIFSEEAKKLLRDYTLYLSEQGQIHSQKIANYCKLNKIPTIFIPHAAVAVYDEELARSDIDYLAVPGKAAKEYLIQKGEYPDKIFVTGRPRYEMFYEGKYEIAALEFKKADTILEGDSPSRIFLNRCEIAIKGIEKSSMSS